MGDFYRICERTGFKVRAGRTRPEWTQHIVRIESWEARQPQDFVRGVPDDQTVPDARPRQPNVFVGPLVTQITAFSTAGSTELFLQTTIGIYQGDTVSFILDNTSTALGYVTKVHPDILMIELKSPIPYSVSAGNYFTDLSSYINSLDGNGILTPDDGDANNALGVGGRGRPQFTPP